MVKALGLPQIIILLVVATGLILAWDFGRRILETVQLVQAAQAADQQLVQVQKVNVQLNQLKQDVTTDDWVIKEARANLHYARDNETLVIPAATPIPSAPPTPVPDVPVPSHSPWDDFIKALQQLFGTNQ